MKLGHVFGPACLGLAFLLGACSNSSSDGGLLNDDGTSTGGSSAKYLVALDGPDCVEPGVTATGYKATVTTRSGAIAKGVYVALAALTDPSDPTSSAGVLRATKPDGGTRLNGADTNDSGVVSFSYTPPLDTIRQSVALTLTATAKVNDASAGDADLSIELAPASTPVVTVSGPKGAKGVRVPSGSLSVESGELASDFVVFVKGSGSGCAAGRALSGATLAVTPKLTAASTRLVQETTALDGSGSFDYVAPTVTVATKDELSVVATYAGVESDPVVYALTVAPPPAPDATAVTISGPSSASPGQAQTGYTALVQTVGADGARVAVQNAKVAVSLSDGGTVTQIANASGLRGVTDAFGKVAFSITPKSSSTASSSIVVTAKVDTTNNTALTSSCALTASRCSGTFDVFVQPDSFSFTSPVFGASGTVGEANAVPLTFAWTTAGDTGASAGVAGCVNLSAAFTGSGTSSYLLRINGDNVPPSQTRMVKLNASGAFQVPVAVLSDRSGFVQVTATENRGCVSTSPPTVSGSLTASTGVQFIDVICETTSDGRNCVDLTAPLRVLSSPDAGGNQRKVDLTFSVLNSAYAPVDGAQVLFSIVTPAKAGDPNERVFPGGGTTNSSGIATSQYYIPTFSPALTSTDVVPVEVQACVRKVATSSDPTAQVCSTRRIEIVGP